MSRNPARGFGEIVVDVPGSILALARWRVSIDKVTGAPGTPLTVMHGDRCVIVEATMRVSDGLLAARLCTTVRVSAGQTTRVRLLVPDVPLRFLGGA